MQDNKKRTAKERRLRARRLRSLSPYQSMTSYIMPDRNDAHVYFSDTIDITEVEKFITEKRKEGMLGLGMLHVIIAAYVRAVAQCPQLNRFICGQQVYAKDDIEVIMTVKRDMRIESEETSIKIVLDQADTLKEVFEKFKVAISDVKDGSTNDTDKLAVALMKLPRFVLRSVMAVLRFLDYHGMLPRAVMDASPMHGSMILTDMGSLGIPPVYHHIYNFGTLPIFISFGNKNRKFVIDSNGVSERRCFIDYCVVIDERICDGSTYAKGVRLLKRMLKSPEVLMTPPEKVEQDID